MENYTNEIISLGVGTLIGYLWNKFTKKKRKYTKKTETKKTTKKKK